MKNKKIYIVLGMLIFSMSFLMLFKTADTLTVKAAGDRQKYEKFAGIMVETIENWGTEADFAPCGQLTAEEVNNFNQTFKNENPRYFYASLKNYYIDVMYGTVHANISYSANARTEKADYEKAVASILKQTNSKWSDYEKVVFINDYITINCEYDTTLKKPHSTDAYGVLINKTAVCQGYAMAFMDLMDRLSVRCEYVSSRTLNHGWNLVKINGKWYHVDVTWNDPVPNSEGKSRHYYLFKSTEFFKSSEKGKHNASDYNVTGGVDLSDVTSTKYDDYFWNNIDSPFVFSSGKWYGIDAETGELIRYTYNKKKGGFVKKGVILKISDKWPVWGRVGSNWIGCYSKLAGYKNFLYYSTPDKIYSYNIKTKAQKAIYTNDNQNGYIYSVVLKNGKLNYYIRKAPNEGVTDQGTIKIK